MWKWHKVRVRRRQKRVDPVAVKHYGEHKEAAREIIHERLGYFNEHYNHFYKRVAIRNQRRCWGSCSSLKNLNFNYKILFLPPHLQDYIIVHELCHLKEMNHGADFWALVAQKMPDYKAHVVELKVIDRENQRQVLLSEIL